MQTHDEKLIKLRKSKSKFYANTPQNKVVNGITDKTENATINESIIINIKRRPLALNLSTSLLLTYSACIKTSQIVSFGYNLEMVVLFLLLYYQ